MELITRAMRILQELGTSNDGFTIKELADKTSLPKATIHRLLTSFKEEGYVLQKEDKRYYLSYKILSLADGIRRNDSLFAQAKEGMKELATAIHRNVILCVMDGLLTVNLETVEQEDSLLFHIRPGVRTPWYATSAGRVYVAYLEEKEKEAIIANTDLSKSELRIPLTKERLLEELKLIRRQGYALFDEELQENVQGVAVPVQEGTGRVVGMLAFLTLKPVAPIKKEQIQALLKCAKKISASIA